MSTLWSIITIVYSIVVVLVVLSVLVQMREPTWSFAWILTIVFIPVAGVLLFFLIGYRPRRKRSETPPNIVRNESYIPFVSLLENNSGAKLTMNNKIDVLHNGDNTFISLAEAIRGAKESIHVEYYIFCEDVVGNQFAEHLLQKAKDGVEVRMIYDAFGSWKLSRNFRKRLREGGIEVGVFSPISFPWHMVNYRNHRKIVVVDGKIAFTGGINIAERYLRGNTLGLWQDVNLRLEGGAVSDLQRLFLEDWAKVSGCSVEGEKYFPSVHIDEVAPMQVVWSDASSAWSAISQGFFAAITGAKRSVYISTPYFIPSTTLLEALSVAALKGVDVKVIIPARSDSMLVYWATCSFVSPLLAAGVKVYLYTAGFLHSKLLVVDDNIASVGSANMDVRSLEDNFEVSTFIYDDRTIGQINDTLADYIINSHLVTPEEWSSRPYTQKILGAVMRLVSPML